MSEFLSEAQIRISADTKKFIADFERAVKKVEATKVLVPVRASMAGFRADLIEKLAASTKGITIKPLVRADMTGFRADLLAKVKTASEGVVATVGVRTAGRVAAGTTGAAAAGAATTGVAASRTKDAAATDKLTKAEQALVDVENARAFARKRSVGEDIEARRLDRLARQTQANVAAEKAYKAALVEGNAAALARADVLRQTTAADVAQTQSVIDRAAAERVAKAERAAAAEAAASEQKVSAERQIQAQITAEFEKAEAERAAIAERQRSVANAQAQTFFAQQAQREKEAAAFRKEAATFEVSQDAARLAKEESAAQKALNKDLAQVNKAENALAAAREKSALSGQAIVGAKTAETEASRKLGIAEKGVAAVTRAEVAAREILDPTLKEETLSRIALARATAEGVVQQRASELEVVREAAARAAANKSVKESFIANTLSLLGLRGSALAANVAFLATSASIITLVKSVSSAAKLESTLNVFKVTAGATADEMKRVSETAQALGRDITLPGVTAQSAADALTELSKAGLSVQDSIDGARGVLQLATAASIDNAQATELAASALNAFGLAGDQTVHVADVLANAANDSQGSITDMGVALQQAAAVARQAGLSLEQTVGALTIFARAGLRGSDAGTSLRTALIRLINPSQKAQQEIQKLGLHLRTATGAINLNVFDEFAQKTRNLTAAQRDQTLAIIFGQDAIRGAAILARTGAQGLDEQITALNKSGTAAELAAARNAGLAGSVENLRNQLSAAGLTIGTVLTPALKLIVDRGTEVIKNVNDMAASFLNATERAKEFGLGLVGAAENAKKANFGAAGQNVPGTPPLRRLVNIDFVPGRLDFTGEKAVRFGVEQALERVSKPPIPFRPPISIDFTDQQLDVAKAREQIKQLVADLARFGGATRFNQTVIDLRKMTVELRKGDASSKKLADDIDVFIKKLQTISSASETNLRPLRLNLDKAFDIDLTRLTSGEPGRLAAEAISSKFISTLGTQQTANARALFDALFGGFEESLPTFVGSLARQAAAAGASVKNAFLEATRVTGAEVSRITNELAAATSAALDVQIEGGTPVEQQKKLLALAKQSEAAARRLVRVRALRVQDVLLSPTGTKAQLAKRKKELDAAKQLVVDAINAQKAAQGAITSIQQDAATKAKTQQDKAQKARNEADQAIIDSFAPREAALDLRDARLADSKNLQAILKAQIDRRALIRQEIAAIQKGFNDRKDAAAKIAALRVQEQNQTNAINATLDQISQAALQPNPVLQARINLAEAEGNIPQQIKFINIAINAIKKLIAAGKAEGKALIDLKTARQTLQNQREDLQNQQIQDRIALGQSIFDLTGKKNPLLQALNAAISETRADIKAAKAAGKSTVTLQTELNNFLKQRKDLLGTAEDATKGTTVFDILKQNVDTFNAIGGNLIQGNQPFAGPTGFTADVAQFLVAQTSRPTTNLTPSAGGKTRVELNDQELIAALDRLRISVDTAGGRSGNDAAGVNPDSVVGQRWAAIGKYWESRTARNYQSANDG